MIHDTIYVDIPIDADALCEAFVYVESKGKSDAVNKVSKESGVLQLMPSMVNEANNEEFHRLDERIGNGMFDHWSLEDYRPRY